MGYKKINYLELPFLHYKAKSIMYILTAYQRRNPIMPTPSFSNMGSVWIFLRSIWVTLKYSFVCLYYSYFGNREQIDRSLRLWSRALLRIVKATCHVHNPHQVHFEPGRAYILMSNHASLYDIPLIFTALPGSIRMIAKKELFRIPIWGHAMKACEFLAIDRKDSGQALKDLTIVREKMQSGIVPWIAPEGTRSRDGTLGLFKKGGFMLAIQTGAVIIPVTLRGAADILPPETLNFRTGRTVEIYVGKPIDAAQYTVPTRTKLLHEVRRSIEEGGVRN